MRLLHSDPLLRRSSGLRVVQTGLPAAQSMDIASLGCVWRGHAEQHFMVFLYAIAYHAVRKTVTHSVSRPVEFEDK